MRKTAWILAAAVSATLTGFGYADDATTAAAPTPADTAALKAQIELLQKQVERIDAAQAAQAERQATTAAVAADAYKQSQMLQTLPFTAGYNNGFKIQSTDGNFVMQPGLIFQFRNITNYNTASDDLQNGFEFRRLRPRLDGVAFTKDLKYSIVFDTGRNVGTLSLLDAWVGYDFSKEWGIKFGQFRNSWVHEGDVPDTKQLTVERSLLDATLGGSITDRVQGVQGSWTPTDVPIQVLASFNDGDNSKNTDFRDSDGTGGTGNTNTNDIINNINASNRVDSNFGASARVQYKFFGAWGDYGQFTAKNVKEDLLVAGGGLDFSQNGDANVTRATADVQYENVAGWSAFGQAIYVYTGADDSSNVGVSGQVGYLINPKVEVFGRYTYINFENQIGGEDNFHEITAGANYYFGPDGQYFHNVKFTVDVNYLPTGSPGNQTGVGYLAGDENQIVVRAQFQLVL